MTKNVNVLRKHLVPVVNVKMAWFVSNDPLGIIAERFMKRSFW